MRAAVQRRRSVPMLDDEPEIDGYQEVVLRLIADLGVDFDWPAAATWCRLHAIRARDEVVDLIATARVAAARVKADRAERGK